MDSTMYIKYENHFKVTILFKDKIAFEAELFENNIPFYVDNNSIESNRYFLLDANRHKIDRILIQTGIIASTDTISMSDYSDVKKVYKVYLYVALVVAIMFIVGIIVF